MKITLRTFQSDAVRELASLLDEASSSYTRNARKWAVGLTATTGAGKTIIATALIERVFFGDDESETPPDDGAVFLWLTDMPQLNIQTREKMADASSRLTRSRLVVIEETFDEPILEPGKVYFLNTQKLGAKASLAQPASDTRTYPFTETVTNTINAGDRTLYLVIDEAHRGMTEGPDREEANSIAQRFIKGVEGVMPPAPIVLGISATPERFRRVVDAVGRTVSQHDVPPEQVRESGLIKDRIIADVAGERQHDAMALLHEAAAAWTESTANWAAYQETYPAADEGPVVPALIVQVENEEGEQPTATDLAAAIRVITEVAGDLPEDAFVHAFGGDVGDIEVGTRNVRYVEPSRIAADLDARVVFFKMSLGTGWDCPRAEVMFSFRRAVDPTSIAQTIGRMVRTPLARRIDEDDRLNTVSVFLPEYDRAAVERIVTYLRESGDAAIGDSVEIRGTTVALPRRAGADAILAAIEAVPSYVVPTVRARADLRRLAALALALSKHGIDPDAWTRENVALAQRLSERREALAGDVAFEKAVADEGEIEIDRLDWAIGDAVPGDPTKRKVQVSPDSVERLFKGAKRVLGETAFAYWKARVEHDPALSNRARLEAAALARRDDVIRALNEHAAARIDALFSHHGAAINALSPSKRAPYITIRGQAAEPTLTTIHLPDVGQFPVGRDPQAWPLHVFAENPEGTVEMGFNTWETPTLAEALEGDGVVGWLRNIPRRDEGSLCVRWRDRNAWHPQFPDFLVVRTVEEGRLVVDILDPHDHTRADAAKKAQGLAEYAQAHGHLLGHIDLLAKIGNSLRRLHLENEQTRQAVAQADTLDALRLLYMQAD